MQTFPQHPWLRYGVAVAGIGAATLLRWLMQPALGDSFPFITYFIAVMFTVWLCRLGPALLATVLGGAATTYFFLLPRYSFDLAEKRAALPLALYFILCATMISIGEAMTRIERRADSLASIVDSSEDAIIGKTLDGTITSWNAGAERIYGYTAAEAVGRPISLIIPPASHDELPDILERLKRGERIEHYETTRLKKNGEQITISLSVSPIKSRKGKIVGASAIARDISERRRAEKSLRDYEERLRMAQRAARVGMWDWNLLTGEAIWSEGIWALLGVEPQTTNLVLEDWLAFVHPEDRERAVRKATEVIAEGEELYDEFRIIRPDGAVRWLASKGRVVRDPEGRAERMVGINIDINERKAAEEEVRLLAEASRALASSLDYETTLESVSRLAVPAMADWCMVELLKPEGSIRRLPLAYADPSKEEAARRLQDYAPDPAGQHPTAVVLRTGQPLMLSADEETRPDDAQEAEHLRVARQMGMRSAIVVPLTGRGAVFGAMTLVYAESGRSYRASDLVLAEELVRRCAQAIDNAQLYREAQRAQAAAEAASRLKDEFLATVSHELRTPLTAILGWSLMLRSQQIDIRTAEHALEVVERNARVQKQIIDDLLDVSRIISGKLRLEVRDFELEPVVRAAIDAVRLAAEAKQINIRMSINPIEGLVAGDCDRLQQVFWNLLSNAVKFTPKGGEIEVRLAQVNSHAEVSVRDTGQGVHADFLPFVFDRFRQADATTTRAHGGLGLGLSIVRHLVEMHGGTVEAASEGQGRGATFTVQLPLARLRAPEPALKDEESGASEAAPAGSQTPAAALKNLRVLVVDDEHDTLSFIKMLLTQHEAEVYTAASASEALDIIEHSHMDVLISDIGMPVKDGYGLIREIRAREATQATREDERKRLPAIALTAYVRAEDRTRALAEGFQAHVVKPVEPDELVAAIVASRGETLPS